MCDDTTDLKLNNIADRLGITRFTNDELDAMERNLTKNNNVYNVLRNNTLFPSYNKYVEHVVKLHEKLLSFVHSIDIQIDKHSKQIETELQNGKNAIITLYKLTIKDFEAMPTFLDKIFRSKTIEIPELTADEINFLCRMMVIFQDRYNYKNQIYIVTTKEYMRPVKLSFTGTYCNIGNIGKYINICMTVKNNDETANYLDFILNSNKKYIVKETEEIQKFNDSLLPSKLTKIIKEMITKNALRYKQQLNSAFETKKEKIYTVTLPTNKFVAKITENDVMNKRNECANQAIKEVVESKIMNEIFNDKGYKNSIILWVYHYTDDKCITYYFNLKYKSNTDTEN